SGKASSINVYFRLLEFFLSTIILTTLSRRGSSKGSSQLRSIISNGLVYLKPVRRNPLISQANR
ncbi:MAG: hypothetical protein ACKOA1_07590, partial [Bacteroidota bacterium]